MSTPVHVVGVGMIPFVKPGANKPYPEMAAEALRAALADAGHRLRRRSQQAYVGYVYGDSTCGQRALYEVGMTGIPIVNVNNNCSTGSTALFLARQAVDSGAVDCALALGFEQMNPGALGAVFNDRPSALRALRRTRPRNWSATPRSRWRCATSAAPAWRTCSSTARRWRPSPRSAPRPAGMRPTTRWRCSARWSRTEEVMAAPMIWPGVMTRLMACPPTCGAAAAILCSEAFAKRHGLDRSVRIRAQAMTTDCARHLRGARHARGGGLQHGAAPRRSRSTRRPASAPSDIDVVELHDCFAQNELLTYEALGLCPEGGAREVRRRRRQHLRRQGRHQSLGRAAEQGPSAGRHRPGAVHRAGRSSCAARPTGARSKARGWRCSTTWVWAAPASSRCTRRSEAERHHDRQEAASATSCRPRPWRWSAAACASSPRPSARPTRSTPTWTPRAPPAMPTCRRRRPSCSPPSWIRARSTALLELLADPAAASCCTASRASATTAPACAGDTITVRPRIDRHLRQEGRRAGVRGQDAEARQPARRARRRTAHGDRVPPPEEMRHERSDASKRRRSATNCRRCSCRRSTAPRWRCSPAPRATTTRSTSTSISRARPACPTCSRTACWAWPGCAGCSPQWVPQSRLRKVRRALRRHHAPGPRDHAAAARWSRSSSVDGERCARIELQHRQPVRPGQASPAKRWSRWPEPNPQTRNTA